MKRNSLILTILLFPLLLSKTVSAHCPLCTIGVGAVAGGAVWLGVSKVVVALFVGAFAMSMGMWFSRIPKKNYIHFQKSLIITVIFVTTVLPLLPIFKVIGPLYFSFIGDYGITYAIDYSLISALIGGVIVFVSPLLSKQISTIRDNRIVPFQGVMITFFLLIIVGGIIQLLV